MAFRRIRHGQSQSFQNRLLLPMSIFDIIGSIGLGFSSMPIPRGSFCTFGAIGNKVTCIAQGLMITLHLIVPMYNAMLSVYYLLAIKYNVKDEAFYKYEAVIHIVSILPALSVAIIAAANDLFNNYSQVCWISESSRFEADLNNPSDHEESNTVLSGLYTTIMTFGGLTFFIIGFSMISLYTSVKTREWKMKSYAFRRPGTENEGTSENRPRRVSQISQDVIDTRIQASLYVGSFILTYLFTVVVLVCDLFFHIASPYPLMLLHGVFAPLQGFWNFLTYFRPRFNIVSRRHHEKRLLQRFVLALCLKPEPIKKARKKRSSQRHKSRTSTRVPQKTPTQTLTRKDNPVIDKNELNPNESTVENSAMNSSIFTRLLQKIKKIFPSRTPSPSCVDSLENADQLGAPTFSASEENYQDHDHDVYDEEEQLEHPSIHLTEPRDYREAVSLSLLVAEDVLPKSLRRKVSRRVSMIDNFSVGIDARTRKDLQPFSTMDPLPNLETPVDFIKGQRKEYSQKRRNSCSVIHQIISEERDDDNL